MAGNLVNTDQTAFQTSTTDNNIRSRLAILKSQDPVRMVLDHVTASKTALFPQRKKWRNQYNAYHGISSLKGKIKGRANLYFRKLYAQIELEAARFITSYFASRPFSTVLPTSGSTVESAQKMEHSLQFYYEHCPSFYLSRQQLVKQTLIYGTSYSVPSWRTERRKVRQYVPVKMHGFDVGMELKEEEQVVYDGLWFDVYGASEVFPYAWPKPGRQIPSYVIEEFIHITELVQRAQDKAYDFGNVMKIPLNSAGQTDAEFRQKMVALGRMEPKLDNDMVRLLHYFTKDRFVTVANDALAIRDISNPHFHNEIPVIQAIKTLDPDSYWPISTAELILPYEKMYNALKNTTIDLAVSGAWPMWKYKAGSIAPSFLQPLPNAKIPVKNMNDVEILQLPETKFDIAAVLLMLQSDIEEATGYFAAQQGRRTPGTSRNTATSDSIFNEQGNIRIAYATESFEEFTLKPEAKQAAKLVQQHMPQNVSMRIGGHGGFDFQDISPGDISGDYDFQVSNGSERINRSVIQQQMINFLGIIGDAQQFVRLPDGQMAPVPLVNNYEYIKSVVNNWDRNLTDKVLYRPEIFGIPLTNDLLGQFNLPAVPGLDQLHQQPGTGARGNVPFTRAGNLTSVNPGRVNQNSVNTPKIGALT